MSTSFEVDGQRTSKLLTPGFGFVRRGGSKKNLVAISESINDFRLGSVVLRHLNFHPVSDGKANKTFSHFAGDLGESELIIRESN